MLLSYIDKVIHTTIPTDENNPVTNFVKRYQIHNHRPSCRRGNSCRFSFPYDVCEETRFVPGIDIIGSKKFYETKRGPNDAMVNAYNPTVLLHWQANMDIQLVNGPIGVAYYVCSYICKSEPNTLKHA